MEKNMENEMETGIIRYFMGCLKESKLHCKYNKPYDVLDVQLK